MARNLRSETVWCQRKKRIVQVTFENIGRWFRPTYIVASCPASADPGASCDKSCANKIGLSSTMNNIPNQALI